MIAKTNLELKHFCSDFKIIRNILKEIGAKKEKIKTQKDYFFFLPLKNTKVPPRLKLRVEGKMQLLVYYERPHFSTNKSTAAHVLLYKVKDKQLLSFLSETLGVKGIVEKRREVWRNGNTVFHLDEIKGVGKVFEVELQKKGTILKKDIKTFKYYQSKLNPYLGKVIRGSNIDLVTHKKRGTLIGK